MKIYQKKSECCLTEQETLKSVVLNTYGAGMVKCIVERVAVKIPRSYACKVCGMWKELKLDKVSRGTVRLHPLNLPMFQTQSFNTLSDFKASTDLEEQGLNILYLNAQSIRNKLFQIEVILHNLNNSVDIVVITETWVGESEQKIFNIPKYTAVYASRVKTGGGCAIFINDSIKFKTIKSKCLGNVTYVRVQLADGMFISTLYNPDHSINNIDNTLSLLEEEFFLIEINQ